MGPGHTGCRPQVLLFKGCGFRNRYSCGVLRSACSNASTAWTRRRSRETGGTGLGTCDHEKCGPDASRRDPCGQCRGRGKYLYGADPVDLYSVGGRKMKKFRIVSGVFSPLRGPVRLKRCTGKTTVEQSGNAYTIYYLNTSGIQLVGKRVPDGDDGPGCAGPGTSR